MRWVLTGTIAACLAALGCGSLLFSAAPAGAWPFAEPTIVGAGTTVSEEPTNPQGLHDQCTGGSFAPLCEGTLTLIHVQVQIPALGGGDCEGPARVGYESDIGGDGHLTKTWPGGDWEQNCYTMGTCTESSGCEVNWTVYPFVYGGMRECTDKKLAVEVSLEFMGNGEAYSKAYPVSIKPWTSGCKNQGSGQSAGGSQGRVTVKQGQATILHADSTEQTCEVGNCSGITFGVGDRVTTGPDTYLEIASGAGKFILGPKTTLTLTAKFIELSGGEARFKLTHSPCRIDVSRPDVSQPAGSGGLIAWIAPKKCDGANLSVKGNAKGAEIRDDNNGQLGVSNGKGRDTVELKRSGEETHVGAKGPPAPPNKPKLKLCRSTANNYESQFGFCLPFHK
jgi:hypothetical protein